MYIGDSAARFLECMLSTTMVLMMARFELSPLSCLGVLLSYLLLHYSLRLRHSLRYELRHVPGPWYCKFSRLPLLAQECRGQRTRWIHALHKRYGPVVRLAWNEIHFNNLEAAKAIYGTNDAIQKDDFYSAFRHDGHDHIFSTLSSADNIRSRKTLSSTFSTTNVHGETCEKVLQSAAESMLKQLERRLRGEDIVNLHDLFTSYSANVISGLVYGQHITDGPIALHQSIDHYYRRLFRKAQLFWPWYALCLLQSMLRWIPMLLPQRVKSNFLPEEVVLHDFGGRLRHIEDKSIFEPFADESLPGRSQFAIMLESCGSSPPEIIAECRALVIAGTVTPPAVLVCLLGILSLDSELVNCLLEEIRTFEEHDPKGLYRVKLPRLKDMPIMAAVFKECLRLFPPIPMTLPRTAVKDITIDGWNVPRGTKIGCQAYSIHRLASSYHEPEVFDHTRWLSRACPSSDKNSPSPDLGFWAFSRGSRICVGQSLAMREMQSALFFLLPKFEFYSVDTVSAENIAWHEDISNFTIRPTISLHVKARQDD